MSRGSALTATERRLVQAGAVAVTVCALSLAAIALASLRPELTEPSVDAAFFVELAPLTTSAPPTTVALPPGPTTIDTAAAPQPPPATPTEQRIDLPPLPRLPDVPPDFAVPAPKQPEPPPAPPAAAPTTVSAAPALPDAPKAERSAAATRGLSDRDRQGILRWQAALAQRIDRAKRYPDGVRRDHPTLTVEVAFALAFDGVVQAARVHRTSGNPAFDQAAVAILERASPLPAPPAAIPDHERQFIVPIRFAARGR